MSRTIDWRALCASADPDFNRRARRNPAYEFTASARAYGDADQNAGDQDTNRRARVFYEDPNRSIAPQSQEGALTWNAVQLTWRGVQLAWDEDA
jgi:hypothetical protein